MARKNTTMTLPDESFEQPQYAELEDLAGEYAEARDERQRIQREDEVPLKHKLIQFMKGKNLNVYKRDGLEVRLVVKEESIKVRMPGAEEIGDDDTDSTDSTDTADGEEGEE